MKQKKQFRLYDIYRTIAIGDTSDIRGIFSYRAELDLSGIFVKICFDGRAIWSGYYYGEQQLKDLVRNVNKRLGNCRKPGKKKGQKKIVMTSGYYPNVTR